MRVIKKTPIMYQMTEGGYSYTRYVDTWLLPPFASDFFGQIGLNLASALLGDLYTIGSA